MIQHAYHQDNYGKFRVIVHETRHDGITTSVSVSITEAGSARGARTELVERIAEDAGV